MRNRRLVFATFLVGLIGGIVLSSPAGREGLSSSSTYAQQKSPLPPNLAALRADVEQLKEVVPDQAHDMTDVCYSCHKAADKPYLRPRIPERPASTMINFDPQAAWPK